MRGTAAATATTTANTILALLPSRLPFILLLQLLLALVILQDGCISNNSNNNSNNKSMTQVHAFLGTTTTTVAVHAHHRTAATNSLVVTLYQQTKNNNNKNNDNDYDNNNDNNNDQEGMLQTKFGGYTVKQRLREEIESPFRTVRLAFFGFSSVSATLALYFSVTNVIRANMGYTTAAGGPSLEESLESCTINVIAVMVCSALTYREYLAGQANLARIAKGGALAKLQVMPASSSTTNALGQRRGTAAATTVSVKEYRRSARVLVAAGGSEYISTLARSLNSDQRTDVNTLPQLLEQVDVIVIPVLLESETRVGDAQACWYATVPTKDGGDANFDIMRSNNIVAFPKGNAAWFEYLESEIETAQKQGFDVLNKGFTIFIKKNGRILRRATGQPQWSAMIGTMEVMDGSRFGMPGDTEKYGGP